MKQKLYFFTIGLFFHLALFSQTQTLSYQKSQYGSGAAETTISNLSTCQLSVTADFDINSYSGGWSTTGTYNFYVNDVLRGSGVNKQTFDLTAYMPINSVKIVKTNGAPFGTVFMTVNITSTESEMPPAPAVTNKYYCPNASAVPLNASLSGSGTTLKWYTSALGENYSATAPTPSTSTIGTTSYWVAQANASGCESLRSKIDVIVGGTPTVTSPVVYTQGDTPTALTATTAGTGLMWYTTATGGTGSTTAIIPETSIVGNTNYWVSSTINTDCESARVPILVTVNSAPPTTLFATQIFTGSDKTLTALQTTGTNIKWYTTPTAGALLPSTTTLVDGTTYYASQTIASNESKSRLAIKVKRISDNTQSFCSESGATIASLVSTPSDGSVVNWYNDAIGGTALANTSSLISGSYYVEESSSNRVLVNVSVITLAKPTVNSPVTYYKGDTASNLLLASGGTGFNLYEFETGGQANPVTELIVPTANSYTTTLWVTSTNDLGCESARQAIVIAVKDIEAPSTPYTTQIYTGNDKTINNIIVSGTNIKWYDAATGGALLPNTTSLVDGNTYFATQTINGNESQNRLAITTKRISENSQLFDPNANPTLASLTSTPSSGGIVKWFSTANGTTELSPSTALSSGTYYVEQTNPSSVETFATGINSSQTVAFSVAVQTDGKIVFGDGYGRLYRMNADGSNRTTIAEGLGIGDLITQSDGTILMAGNNAVSRINTDGSVVTLNSNLAFPEGIAVQADGKILIADYQLISTGNVKRMNADGSNLVTLNATIESPYSVAEETDGKILVADPNQTSILRMNADGTNVVNVGSGFSYPSKVLVQADGKILVLDQNNNAIKRMDADGTNIETLKNDFSLPQDMNMDASGAIYVSDTGTNTIIKIEAPTKTNRVPVNVNLFTNDDCNGAITLNVGSEFATNAVEVDLSLATNSSAVPTPSCGNYQGADVWYKVVVPSSGELNIKTGNLTGENPVNTAMALYSGDCNGLTPLACNDDESGVITTSSIVLSGLSADAILYLRVWKNQGNTAGKIKANVFTSKFTISAFSNATLSNDGFKTVDYVIYPNPTSGKLTIDATNLTNPLLSVFDLNGKLILNEKLQADKNALNFSTLNNGVYLFKIKSQEGETVKKVIKN